HVPPNTRGTSHTTNVVPLATSIRNSLPLAKKAMVLPSGDQNGDAASSLPRSRRGFVSSRDRSQRAYLPSTVAPNTAVLPSGDSARFGPRPPAEASRPNSPLSG